MGTTGVYCRECGYDLRGQVGAEQRCPECGRGFDAGDKRTFRRRPLPGGALRWWLRRVVAILLLLGFVLGTSLAWIYQGWKREHVAVDKMDIIVSDQVTWEPMGGRRLQRYLGPAGWTLDRVTALTLYSASGVEYLKNLTSLRQLTLHSEEVTDAQLENIKDLTELRVLDLAHSQVSDAGLKHLRGLRGLQSLNLELTYGRITDAGLDSLKDLKELRYLDLRTAAVTDAGLEKLKGFHELQWLNLGDTPITDAGLIHLRGLKNLCHLELWLTRVSDAGLEELQECKGLTLLAVWETRVTAAGVKKVRAASPGLRISFEPMKVGPT